MNHPGSPFWVPSAALQRHVNRTATGNPDCDWLSHVRAEHLPRCVDRTLVLGCGNGFLERALARQPGIGEILATDPNAASVEAAAKAAGRAGLTAIAYRRMDPETDALPEGPWNLVLANDLLHHVADPEPILRSIRESLAPGGHFVFSEYTGPPRFQHGAVTLEIVERYFRLLPDRIRTDPDTGRLLWRHEPVDAARLAREHPSEAAVSATLLPLARRLFAADAELSGGGGLLHPLLSGFARNFRQGSMEDERLLEVLCAEEERATSLGILAPLFTAFIGRRHA
jgi:SAM-dependent methyltransferase